MRAPAGRAAQDGRSDPGEGDAGPLEQLARADATVAPLARLQAEVQRATGDAAWDAAVPDLDLGTLQRGLPLLHGQTLRVAVPAVEALLRRLVAVAIEAGASGVDPVHAALAARSVDPLALLEAAVTQDDERLCQWAGSAGADADVCATLGQLAVVPLLRAVGCRAAPLLDGTAWDAGYCPVCAGWPALAELRGLDRRRWLRCGRCGASWVYYQQRCVYCGNNDPKTLGYLAPEADREARRAITCDRCQGYLKAITVVGALAPGAIALRDLQTLELDVAALDRGYARPEASGFPLAVSIVSAPAAASRRGWLPWR